MLRAPRWHASPTWAAPTTCPSWEAARSISFATRWVGKRPSGSAIRGRPFGGSRIVSVSERAVLTVALGNAHYTALAVNLARSFVRWHRGTSIGFRLVTDHPELIP